MHRVVAADVPGGPGNVPIGYSRECRRVPYTVCDANGCRTEYGWVCYFRPISAPGEALYALLRSDRLGLL